MLNIPQANKVYRTREQRIHDFAESPEGRIAIAFHKINADPKSRDKLRANDLYLHAPQPPAPQKCTIYRFERGKVTDQWKYAGRDEMTVDEFYRGGDPKEKQ